MTLSATTIARQAAMLCSGYRVGYFTDADIERWAERQINALDEPPLPLIEVGNAARHVSNRRDEPPQIYRRHVLARDAY